MRHEQQRTRDTQARISSVVRGTAAGVEQSFFVEVDECAAKNRIVALLEYGDRRAFLHPQQIGHLDAGFLRALLMPSASSDRKREVFRATTRDGTWMKGPPSLTPIELGPNREAFFWLYRLLAPCPQKSLRRPKTPSLHMGKGVQFFNAIRPTKLWFFQKHWILLV
jgi:hypothetical protein